MTGKRPGSLKWLAKKPGGIEASVVSWKLYAKESKWVKAEGESHLFSIAETARPGFLSDLSQDLQQNDP